MDENFIDRYLKSMVNSAKYEFVDNIRKARMDNPEEMKVYIEQMKKGCCGCVDEVMWDGDGTPYVIGFNYGH